MLSFSSCPVSCWDFSSPFPPQLQELGSQVSLHLQSLRTSTGLRTCALAPAGFPEPLAPCINLFLGELDSVLWPDS